MVDKLHVSYSVYHLFVILSVIKLTLMKYYCLLFDKQRNHHMLETFRHYNTYSNEMQKCDLEVLLGHAELELSS